MEYVAESIEVSSHIDIAMPMEFERMANEIDDKGKHFF